MQQNFGNKFYFLFLIALNLLILTNHSLDSTFGNGNGFVFTQYNNSLTFTNVITQSDNKIIAIGFTGNSKSQIILVRYNADGTLDNNFGSNGIVITQIGSVSSTNQIFSVVLQADNKIVVCGDYYDNSVPAQFVVIRYNNDGTPDDTFGTNGIVTTLIGDACSAASLAIDANSNIIVAGNSVINGNGQIAIVRYTSLGVLDSTFADNGIVIIPGTQINVASLILDNTGNIIIGGSCSIGFPSSQFMLLKFSSEGTPDYSFGNNGMVQTQINNFSQINQIAFDNNGNIVAAGYCMDININNYVAIARYLTNGVLDTTFNNSGEVPGIVQENFNQQSFAQSLAIDDNNSITICGNSSQDKNSLLAARFTTSGDLDTTFAQNGYSILSIDKQSQAKFVTLQTDQKILVAGYAIDSNNNSYGILTRYNKNNLNNIIISNLVNNSTIKQNTVTINGTSTGNNSLINLFLDDVQYAQVTTDNEGNWSAPTSSVLSSGAHTLRAQLLDNSNNILISILISFVVDTSSVSSFSAGNVIRVDAIFGDDTAGLRNGAPFMTINAALKAAIPGDTVQIQPGIYNESFAIPNFVSVRGVSTGTCIIRQIVTVDTDLITMGEYCVLEDVTLQLISSNHVQLRGVVFPGTTTVTSALRGLRILVDNSSASSSGSSNVYGIHSIGIGLPVSASLSALEVSMIVKSIGAGNKRGVLIDTASGFNMALCLAYVTGVGLGSYIGVETNNASSSFESHACLIQGVNTDVSQTLGKLILYDTDLINLNTNNLGFTTKKSSGVMFFADSGFVNFGTNYLRPGTAAASISEIKFKLSNRMLIKAMNVKLLNPPGSGQSVAVTLRKNGVNTPMLATLVDNQISTSKTSNSIMFEPGDYLSVSINGSLGNIASDIIVTLELY